MGTEMRRESSLCRSDGGVGWQGKKKMMTLVRQRWARLCLVVSKVALVTTTYYSY